MATNVNVTSNYTGDLAKEILVQAFKSADTLAKDVITPLTNVVGSAYLPKLSFSADIAAYACGWNPSGDVTYNEKEIVTKKLMIPMEICKNDFYATFQSKRDGLGADNDIPSDIKTAVLDAFVKNQAAKIDNMIWNGATGSSAAFAGLLPQFTADSSVVKVTGTTSSISNVVTEIAKVYNTILPEIDEDADLVFLVSKNIAKNYRQNQASQGNNTTVGAKELDYLGTPLITMSAFANDVMVVYRKTNVAFGTDLLSDLIEVRIADDEARLDGNILIKSVFTGGVGYSFGEEIVYYRK